MMRQVELPAKRSVERKFMLSCSRVMLHAPIIVPGIIVITLELIFSLLLAWSME